MGKEIDFIVMCRAYWQNSSLNQRVLLVFYYQGSTKPCCYWVFMSFPCLFLLSFLPWQWEQHLCCPEPAAAGAWAGAHGLRAPSLEGKGRFFRLWHWPAAPAPCPGPCPWGLIGIKDYKRGSAGCIQGAPGTGGNIQAAALAGLASWTVHSAGPSGPWAI